MCKALYHSFWVMILIADDNTGTFYVFEMGIGMNKCDHGILITSLKWCSVEVIMPP